MESAENKASLRGFMASPQALSILKRGCYFKDKGVSFYYVGSSFMGKDVRFYYVSSSVLVSMGSRTIFHDGVVMVQEVLCVSH